MDQKEMINEEVVEIAEEIASAGTGRGLKMFGLGAATIVVGGVAYKFGVKPLINKIKAKKEARSIETCEDCDGQCESQFVDETEE